MKTKQIKELKQQGYGNDTIYQIAAGNLGLFGIAFFGHKFRDRQKHRKAKRTLNTVWKRILETI